MPGHIFSTYVVLSCFVEHKESKYEQKVCCEGYEEDAHGICVGKSLKLCTFQTRYAEPIEVRRKPDKM